MARLRRDYLARLAWQGVSSRTDTNKKATLMVALFLGVVRGFSATYAGRFNVITLSAPLFSSSSRSPKRRQASRISGS